MTASHPVRCRCGQFEAWIARPERAVRGVCYCRDCRAYAHFLGPPPGLLDDFGGTDAVVVIPASVTLERGVEHLACMSLSPRGTLRWYSRCCRTPIANTPRDWRIAHLSFVHDCLRHAGPSLDESFGPVRMKVNRVSAHGDPGGVPLIPFLAAAVRYTAALAWNRVSGGYRRNPFFDAAGEPRVAPHVIGMAEREALMARV
jgi:Family of unknown function (DUF6151)